MSPREEILILDPKGGLQVLLAKEYGSGRITKVESTPNLIETVNRELGVSQAASTTGRPGRSSAGRGCLRRKKDLI